MTLNILEVKYSDADYMDNKVFVPAEQMPIPEWPCVLGDRPQPTLTLKGDELFLITDTLGNIAGSCRDDIAASMGLFCNDTRFLSRLELQIDGRSPVLLNSTAEKGFMLSVLCTNPQIETGSAILRADSLGIRREMVLSSGLFEELEICNYSTSAVCFELSLSFDADFADLFEVRGSKRPQRGQILREVKEEPKSSLDRPARIEELTLAYRGLDESLTESYIQFAHRQPDELKGYTAVWQLKLASHETQKLGYRLQMVTNKKLTSKVSSPVTLVQAKALELSEEQTWSQQVARIHSDDPVFNQILDQAEQDIYLLRQTFGKNKALSAGVPWFSTLFGRDSIISASQTLILDSNIARETLLILAAYQGKVDDEWRDEQPGKILHELRVGEMARCGEVPHTPYYGTIDATPLWLMLYAEYYAWTHDRETLEQLWPKARAAMDWVDRNCQDLGYLSYARKSKRGLANQGWKDSDNCIVDRRGQIATGPIALVEVQAYVYAAKMR